MFNKKIYFKLIVLFLLIVLTLSIYNNNKPFNYEKLKGYNELTDILKVDNINFMEEHEKIINVLIQLWNKYGYSIEIKDEKELDGIGYKEIEAKSKNITMSYVYTNNGVIPGDNYNNVAGQSYTDYPFFGLIIVINNLSSSIKGVEETIEIVGKGKLDKLSEKYKEVLLGYKLNNECKTGTIYRTPNKIGEFATQIYLNNNPINNKPNTRLEINIERLYDNLKKDKRKK